MVKPRPGLKYEMSEEALELSHAVYRWRERHDGRFPSIEQLVEILRGLGWRRTETGSNGSDQGDGSDVAPPHSAAEAARTCGRRAGLNGHPERSCPYGHGDPRRHHWLAAYRGALSERARARREGKGSRRLTPEQRERRAASRMENARERGRRAAREGRTKRSCPYATAVGGFRAAWMEGFGGG